MEGIDLVKYKYIAHVLDEKEQDLSEHLRNVSDFAREEGKKIGIGNLMELVGSVHDLGKYGDSFQKYIRQKDDVKIQKGSVNHSTAGAKWIYSTYGDGKRTWWKEMLVELIAYAISAHHGLYDLTTIDGVDKYAQRIKQEPECYEEACARFEGKNITEEDLYKKFKSAYVELTMNIKPKINILMAQTSEKVQKYYYGCLQRFVLSILIDADWTDTARFMKQEKRDSNPINYKAIYEKSLGYFYKYMQQLHDSTKNRELTEKEENIRKLRDSIQAECIAFAKNPSGIYCLPIPTGGGKTLSGLAYALEYVNQHKETEKIIYVSHFLSVIEQNSEVIKTAIGSENAKWVLEHHSNVIMDEESGGKKEVWALNWEEPFVCTTLVQFFQTLFSNKKQAIRRFHRLKNAVIILDEIQSLPVRTIHTFNLIMNFLKEVCNTTVILCTATQPLLGEEGVKHPILYGTPKNMITDVAARFEEFERVVIKDARIRNGYTFDAIKQFINNLMVEKEYHSILVILNSKYAVEQIFEKMKDQVESEWEVVYLTTNLCAEHRKDIFENIKERLGNKEKILIISTSLIEAGVDLSTECVIRSMAGLDSIAQAAGRCNRNGEIDRGEVYIVNLEDERIDKMQELRFAINVTSMVLDYYEKQKGTESLLSPKWMDVYYQQYFFERRGEMDYNLPEAGENYTIYKLLSAGFCSNKFPYRILNQAFKTAGENYQIIKNETVDVIVPYGGGITYIVELDAAEKICDIYSILRRAQRYTVSLYDYKIKDLLQKGVVRQCEKISDIYIANSYDDKKGITEILTDLIY